MKAAAIHYNVNNRTAAAVHYNANNRTLTYTF
jgi:hypothetical protein